MPTRAAAYRALESHDARFDGLIFVAVKSTGIYCRPVCPARTPKFENCEFYPSAAAAQDAGYRPCLRCRPETAPQLAAWRGTSNTVSRAMALIAEGALDGPDCTVDTLATRLGVGERQLRRLFLQQLGTSPISVAQTRRVHFAKQLLHDTTLPMAEVALASGFQSLRRFNEVFQQLFHRPPTALRRQAGRDLSAAEGEITLQIRYRGLYDWDAMLAFFAARAIPGVEVIQRGTYCRTIELDGAIGTLRVGHRPRHQSLSLAIRFPAVRALPIIIQRVRRLFDLDANIDFIREHLSQDAQLAAHIALRPGLRVPGCWDPFELAMRAILGQQITVSAARQLAGHLVEACGRKLPVDNQVHAALTHVFPTPQRVACTSALKLPMPAARRQTLLALAQAGLNDPSFFSATNSPQQDRERLLALPGIGEWTAQYILLRALREPDAFPATDIGLLRGAEKVFGCAFTPSALLARSTRWSPWRAYAAQHLWAADLPVSPSPSAAGKEASHAVA